MAARRPFWKWKSIGFSLWLPSTCIWNLKLKFQSKLDLCSGNHVVYRQTDGRTDGRTRWIQYTPPPTSLGGGIKMVWYWDQLSETTTNHIVTKFFLDPHLTKCRWGTPILGISRLWALYSPCLQWQMWCNMTDRPSITSRHDRCGTNSVQKHCCPNDAIKWRDLIKGKSILPNPRFSNPFKTQ